MKSIVARVFCLVMLLLIFPNASSQAKNDYKQRVDFTPQEQAFLNAHPILRVANEMDWPPFDFHEFGKPKGLCIDYIKMLAKKAGFEIQFVNGYTWSELLSLFRKKQIDIIPAIYKNKEREAYTLFTAPYYKGKLGIFTNDKTNSIDNVTDLLSKKVGIQTSHGSISSIRRQVPDVALIEVDKTTDLVTQLATGKLDAIIGNPLLFYYNARDNQVTNIRLTGYVDNDIADKSATVMHVGVRKDWPLLHQILQKTIAAVSEEEMDELKGRWLGSLPREQEEDTILLTEAEQIFLANHPVIRIQNEDDYPPYDFSEYGQPMGFSIDYLQLIAQKTGLNFTFINGFTWTQILENIQDKKLDVIHTCLNTKERKEYATFTESYAESTYALIVPSDTDIVSIEDLSGKSLAVLKGTKHIEYISKLNFSIKFIEYETTREILRSVLFNECDAAYESLQLAGYTIEKEGLIGLDFRPVEMLEAGSGSWRIGVRKDWPELLSIINKGMTAISKSEMSSIKSKWFGLSDIQNITIDLTKKEQDFISNHPVLKVSNEMDYPPYDFTIGKQPQGYSIDLLNMLAERLGITVSYINGYTWSQLQRMFNMGEIDLLHTLNQTPERKAKGLFSEPYHFYKNHWVIGINEPEIEDIEQLYGKIVAVGKGWSQEEFLNSSYPKVRLLTVDGLDSMLDSVLTGKADALLGEVPVMQYILKKRGITDLKFSGWAREYDRGSTRKFHFMAQNSAPELISMLNKALLSLTPGDMDDLERKWFGNPEKVLPDSATQITFTSEEAEYLRKKGAIRLSAFPKWMPYQNFDEAGGLEGMGATYLSLFEERLGLTFQVIPVKTSKEAIASIPKGTIDAILLAEVTTARDNHMDISTPYISFPYVIATTNDKRFVEDISKKLNKTFAIVSGTGIIDKLLKHYPTIRLLEVNSILEGLQKVSKGKVFGFIDTSAAIGHTIQQELLLDLKITGTLPYHLDLGVATRGDEPSLGTIFQKAVDSLNNEDKQKIYNQWVAVNYEQGIDYSLIWKILVVAFVLIIFILYWNRKLYSARNAKQQAIDKLNATQHQLEIKNIELKEASIRDFLTGLYNRRYFYDSGGILFAISRRDQIGLVCAMIDIDFFKKVNDTYGHDVGDLALQQVSTLIHGRMRASDIVARMGGEEFCVLAVNMCLTETEKVFNDLRQCIEKTPVVFDNKTKRLYVTVSIGICTEKTESLEQMTKVADKFLYQAKESGRNCIRISREKN